MRTVSERTLDVVKLTSVFVAMYSVPSYVLCFLFVLCDGRWSFSSGGPALLSSAPTPPNLTVGVSAASRVVLPQVTTSTAVVTGSGTPPMVVVPASTWPVLSLPTFSVLGSHTSG